jgi:hypothetical protein
MFVVVTCTKKEIVKLVVFQWYFISVYPLEFERYWWPFFFSVTFGRVIYDCGCILVESDKEQTEG